MVEYAVSDLVKEVKVLLDRNQESAGLLAPSDSDTLSQAELIESKIVDAARIILSDAPEVEGTSCKNAVTWTDSNGYYVGKMVLPTDMLRILSVKAEGWNRPAEIISESDDAYKYQNCKYGVRGNPERPIAAIVHTANGKSIELYTSTKQDATLAFIYVQVPSITTEQKISLPSVLKDSILYMAGYLTCVSLGDTDTASGFLGVARKLAHIVEPTTS
ncbi:MAG: hypothetical protein ACLS3J_10720 [Segatella copri]|jgi:hypothetical protein